MTTTTTEPEPGASASQHQQGRPRHPEISGPPDPAGQSGEAKERRDREAKQAKERRDREAKQAKEGSLGLRLQRVSLAAPGTRRTITLAISDLQTGERLVAWALDNLLRRPRQQEPGGEGEEEEQEAPGGGGGEGDRVLLLHVRPYLYPPDTYLTPALIDIGGVWDFDDSYEITNRRIAHKTLAYLKRLLAEAGVDCVPLALRGEARQVLEEKARELGTDIMVVGTRELGGFTRLWEGSVGDHLLHHLDCPLVVVR